jgi:hypothetical protein
MKAFAMFSLPFVMAEALTGFVSFMTGVLAMPPVVGVVMAVDIMILIAGLWKAAQRGSRGEAIGS